MSARGPVLTWIWITFVNFTMTARVPGYRRTRATLASVTTGYLIDALGAILAWLQSLAGGSRFVLAASPFELCASAVTIERIQLNGLLWQCRSTFVALSSM